MDVEGERSGDLHPFHQGKRGAVGEGEFLIPVALEKLPSPRRVLLGNLEDRGDGEIEESPPETNRWRVAETGPGEIERFDHNQIGRSQRKGIGTDETHRSGVMAIGPVNEGEVGGGIDKDHLGAWFTGHG